MISMTLRLLGAMAVAMSAAIVNAAPPTDAFANCREQFARDPGDYESSYCFYQVALDRRLWDEGGRLFEELMKEHPTNFWLPLAYGHMYRDRGAAPIARRRCIERRPTAFAAWAMPRVRFSPAATSETLLFPRGVCRRPPARWNAWWRSEPPSMIRSSKRARGRFRPHTCRTRAAILGWPTGC